MIGRGIWVTFTQSLAPPSPRMTMNGMVRSSDQENRVRHLWVSHEDERPGLDAMQSQRANQNGGAGGAGDAQRQHRSKRGRHGSIGAGLGSDDALRVAFPNVSG